MANKKIGIMTTGGDCSGLNTVIQRLVEGCSRRKWNVIGIKDGTDGLYENPPVTVDLSRETFQFASSHLAGSILSNGNASSNSFAESARSGKISAFNKRLQKSLKDLNLDAMVLIGGNGSLSLSHLYKEIYTGLQLVCIPKTIDICKQ